MPLLYKIPFFLDSIMYVIVHFLEIIVVSVILCSQDNVQYMQPIDMKLEQFL